MNMCLRICRWQRKEKVFQSFKEIEATMVYYVLIKVLFLTNIVKYVQIMLYFVLPHNLGSSGANYAKNLLRLAILVQYIPRLYRFLPLLIGQSPTGFIFESAWGNFVINLLIFMLSGHVVGSCWYLFGLQVGENNRGFLDFIIWIKLLHGTGGSCYEQRERRKKKKYYLIH